MKRKIKKGENINQSILYLLSDNIVIKKKRKLINKWMMMWMSDLIFFLLFYKVKSNNLR